MTRSFIFQLQSADRSLFETKIRESGYGGIDQLLAWLESKGVQSSRSSVHRYATAVKEADGVKDQASTNRMAVKNREPGGELAKLFQRLGELEYERRKIETQISDLMTAKTPD